MAQDVGLSIFMLILLVFIFLLGCFVTCFWLFLCNLMLQPVRVRSDRTQASHIKEDNNRYS